MDLVLKEKKRQEYTYEDRLAFISEELNKEENEPKEVNSSSFAYKLPAQNDESLDNYDKNWKYIEVMENTKKDFSKLPTNMVDIEYIYLKLMQYKKDASITLPSLTLISKVDFDLPISNRPGGNFTVIETPDGEKFDPISEDHVEARKYKQTAIVSENTVSKVLSEIKDKQSTLFRKEKKSPLSNEFKVAAEIYRFEVTGKLVWYTKLYNSLKGEMSKNTVTKALNVLFDWGIVTIQYGETENNRPGKLYKIAPSSKSTIKNLYNKYWKEYRSSL